MKSSFLAHGKVILIGEHSVVYGYDALAMPITALHIKTTVEETEGPVYMNTAHYQGPLFDAPANYDGLKYVVKTMMDKASSTDNVKITYTGEIPMERGFGSSATVALGTVKAMDNYYKLNLSNSEIMDITNHAEMINHGKASGLDAATVSSDYLVFFNKEIGPQKLQAKLGATLLIMVRQQLDESVEANKKIERLGKLADNFKAAWIKQDKKTAGEIFNDAEEILASFGLATDKINQLKTIALANGALGFKFSGGGLGGIVIAICDNREIAQQIADKSKDLISNYWIEEV